MQKLDPFSSFPGERKIEILPDFKQEAQYRAQ